MYNAPGSCSDSRKEDASLVADAPRLMKAPACVRFDEFPVVFPSTLASRPKPLQAHLPFADSPFSVTHAPSHFSLADRFSQLSAVLHLSTVAFLFSSKLFPAVNNLPHSL